MVAYDLESRLAVLRWATIAGDGKGGALLDRNFWHRLPLPAPKGEGCMSFVIGVLFGPFGILFALLSSGNRVTCPNCREKIHREATVCPRCQRAVKGAG